MLTRNQIDQYVKEVPSTANAEERRSAYCVITGFGDGKTASEISQYYSIEKDVISYWMNHFSFDDIKSESSGKRSGKTKKIEEYLKTNVGKIITPKQMAEEIDMSLPTFYNYYNSNRSYFKKVQRGKFEIVDPKVERMKV
jgi:hypothetical protein